MVNMMVLWIRCCNGPPELSALGKLLEWYRKDAFGDTILRRRGTRHFDSGGSLAEGKLSVRATCLVLLASQHGQKSFADC